MSILDNIGNTPLVEIKNIWKSDRVKIFAKVEGMNPGGSVKDRIAKHMILKAINAGKLKPRMEVIEATSGNTAIGLAMVCAALKIKCNLVMPKSVSVERSQICRAYGATIVLIDGSMDDAIKHVEDIMQSQVKLALDYSIPTNCLFFNPNQFDNPSNYLAHYHNTGPEICHQLRRALNWTGYSYPNPTHFVAACGTTGTIRGCAEWFKNNTGCKEEYIDTKIIAVFPKKDSKIQGLKNLQFSRVPKIHKKELIDESIYADDKEAFDMTKRLAREEGLFCGMSSGAAMAVAIKKAKTLDSGIIVVILPDNGYRYLSEGIF